MKTLKCNWLIYAYTAITLLLGVSTLQFFGLTPDNEFLKSIHPYSMVALIAYMVINHLYYKITRTEQILLVLMVTMYIVQSVFGIETNAGLLVNMILEPVLLLVLVRNMPVALFGTLRKIIIVCFLIECGVAVAEAVTQQLIFMRDQSAIIDNRGDIRATAIHGHPLSNAALVSLVTCSLLLSNGMGKLKYYFAVVGFAAVFAFNTRSSIMIMSGVLLFHLFMNIRSGNASLFSKLFTIGLVAVLAVLFFRFTSEHALGTRMDITISSDDSSTLARMMILESVTSMSMENILFGVDGFYIDSLLRRMGMIAVENSFVYIMFYEGLIFLFVYLVFFMKNILRMIPKNSFTIMYMLVLFALLNVNNVATTSCPIFPVFILCLFTFVVPYKKQIIR